MYIIKCILLLPAFTLKLVSNPQATEQVVSSEPAKSYLYLQLAVP